MLDYEWVNPTTMILTADEPVQDSDQTHHHNHIFDPYTHSSSFNEPTQTLINPNPNYPFTTTTHQNHHFQTLAISHNTTQPYYNSLYDPRAYDGASSYHHHHPTTQPSILSLEPSGPTGFMLMPKTEPGPEYSSSSSGAGGVEFNSRLGLNLGGRTYFSSTEHDFLNRLYRRSRVVEPGSVNTPRCQAEGCNADLTHVKHYHRRHKVCEFHSKAATVLAGGLTQRFCQQCSRFHILSEFDNGKRSCRKRLADHNRRRRKSQQPNQENGNKSQLDHARILSSENLARSPPDSGAHSSSSATIAISPPRISLDSFRQRSYQATTATTSSASTSSFFFTN